MEFEIRAKYDALIGLQNEMKKLEKQLLSTSRATDSKEYDKLLNRLSTVKGDIVELNDQILVASGDIRGGLVESLKSARSALEEAQKGFEESTESVVALQKKVNETAKAYSDAEINELPEEELKSLAAAAIKAYEELNEATEKQAEWGKAAIEAKKQTDEFSAALDDLDGKLPDVADDSEDAAEGLYKLGKMVAGGFVVKKFIGDIMGARMQIQNMQTALETMVGKDTAGVLFDQLYTIAKKSPLEISDLMSAEQMMISFGIDSQKTIGYLNALSDISMGDAGKFNSLTLAFSQMSATGKLMGQDLNQMINQGFNPLEAMATQTGKSIAQLKDEMSKGKITAEMVQQAFIDVTKEGGRFYNMSEAASKTMQGQISMFQDALNSMYASMGEKFEGTAMNAIQMATTLLNNWQELVPVVLAVAGAIGVAKTALVIHTTWQKASNVQLALNNALMRQGGTGTASFTKALGQVIKTQIASTSAQRGLNMAVAAFPYMMIGAAIAALCYGIYKWANYMTAAEKAHEALNKAMADADVEADKEKRKLEELAGTLATLDEKSAQYASTKNQIIDIAKKYNAEIAEEIEKNGLTEKSYADLSDAIQRHYRTKAYLRWKDSQEEQRQEAIQAQMAEIREQVQKEYVDKATTDEERLRRTREAAVALQELSSKAYAGQKADTGEMSAKDMAINAGAGLELLNNAVSGALRNSDKGFGARRASSGGKWEFNKLSKETNDLLQKVQGEQWDIVGLDNVGKSIYDMFENAYEVKQEIDSELNLSSFGLTQADIDGAKNAAAAAAEKKAKEEQDKKDKESAEKAKSAKEDAAKKTKGLKDYFEGLDKDVRDSEMAANGSTLLKELAKIEADYNAKIDKVKEKKEELAKARKEGTVDGKTADEWDSKADSAIGTLNRLKGEEREKYLKKLNSEALGEAAVDEEDISAKMRADIKKIEDGYDKEIETLQKKKREMAEAVSSGLASQEEADTFNLNADISITRNQEGKAKAELDYYKSLVESTEKEVLGISEKYEAKRTDIKKKYADERWQMEWAAEHAPDEETRGKAQSALANIDTAQKADLAKVDLEEFKESEQYTTIFKDLGKYGQTTLTALKEQMEAFGDSIRKSLNPADAKAFEESMQALENRLVELDPFAALSESRDALSEAMERKGKATEKVTAALKEYKTIQKQLDKEEKKSVKDTKKIASLKDRLAQSTTKLENANTELADAEDDVAQSTSQSQKAQEQIKQAFSELEQNAKAVSEVLGSEVGDVFNFIDSTVELVNISCEGMKKSSETTSAALQAVETASVILAIIGAAMKVVQILDKFVNKEDKAEQAYKKAVEAQKEINKMADAVNSYEKAVKSAERAEKNWFSSTTLSGMRDSWNAASDALDSYNKKVNQQQVKYQNEKGGKSFLHRIGNTIKATGGAGLAGFKSYKDEQKGSGSVEYVNAIDNLRFETQSKKKGGFFKKGRDQKTVDLRTWAKETYGSDLFGDDGMVDVEMARNIIDNYGDKLVGETKETLEALVEQAEAYKEAMDQIKQAVADMFSPLTDNLTDAVWNWLETGEDAMKTFKDNAASTFQSIAKDMIKTLANKLIFDKMSKQIEDLGEKFAKGEISEEEMMKSAIDIVDSGMAGAEAQMKMLQQAAKNMDDYAKEHGYNMTGSSEVTASGGGFETMSEDTASELSGRFAALYESGLRQEGFLERISGYVCPNGSITSASYTIAGITSTGFSNLLAQTQDVAGLTSGISDCLAQSYLTLQEIHETGERQTKCLLAIQTELVKVRKVTDTL